jgi:hypothetical protein
MNDLSNSPAAIVCHKHHAGEMGGDTEFFVRLADGFLVSCGLSESRAFILAHLINKAGPELLHKTVLRKWRPGMTINELLGEE